MAREGVVSAASSKMGKPLETRPALPVASKKAASPASGQGVFKGSRWGERHEIERVQFGWRVKRGEMLYFSGNSVGASL